MELFHKIPLLSQNLKLIDSPTTITKNIAPCFYFMIISLAARNSYFLEVRHHIDGLLSIKTVIIHTMYDMTYYKIILNQQILTQIMQAKQVQLKDGIHAITIQHVPFIKKILANTFLERNEVWKSFAMDRNQLQDFFERTVILHLQCQEIARKKFGPNFTIELMFVRDGKIAATLEHFQLDTYKQVVLKSDKEEKLPLFKALEKEGKKLIEGVNINKYPPGTAVYINFGSVNNQFNLTPNERLYMLTSFNLALKKCGIRWAIARSSNPRATKLYENLGGKVVNEVMFEKDGLKFPLYFLELDMENPKFLEIEKNFNLIQRKYLQQLKKSKSKI